MFRNVAAVERAVSQAKYEDARAKRQAIAASSGKPLCTRDSLLRAAMHAHLLAVCQSEPGDVFFSIGRRAQTDAPSEFLVAPLADFLECP
eukprot:3258965-Alexandrium_andersonii.AAC.1